MSAGEITNQVRIDTVLRACDTAFAEAKQAWRREDDQSRALWIGIQCACGDELQDLVAATKAGVP